MRALTLVCAAAALAACTPRINTDPDTGRVDVDMQPVTQRGEVWNARIAGTGSAAALTGTATATAREGHIVATMNLSGAQAGGVHPWAIHEGTCAAGGAMVGAAGTYPVLQVGSNGQATATAHVMAQLNEARDYHVRVHASQTDMATVVACGALED
ncbi:MAG TPA: hypothetical protein VGV85_13620 [Longimicrobiaceae bacterium]|nr:hypothetical protein [Longimicrobiaceae bacterium]